ncbi:hypothetical protein POM88_002656 [Heracleum sosnowskyi]|uniref:Uncharacterized protein n=1 Tax=Heracleum sosnowskyi TaxID=360622 RepID=A0AAD8NC68_9APIA|nr:hypothetical protein POM88_002656 [Heracleum sosnowskyi]
MSSPSHQFIFNNYDAQYNVAFINVIPLQQRENGNHAIVGIFGISVTVLLTALQLKYQAAGTNSPFEDYPEAMAIAIASFIIFCLVYEMEQYFHITRRHSTFATLLQHVLRLLAFISLASLASVIFSTSSISTKSLIVYLMFPCFFSARLVLQWIQNRTLHDNTEAYSFQNLHPRFIFSNYFDSIDTLPVYRSASANLLH